MTVNTSDITDGPYTGNGVTTEFAYNFRVDLKTDLKVFETTDLGVETVLTVDTHYTVASVRNDAGGLITRVAGALPTDYEWFIRANYPETQLVNFTSQGAFFPGIHETAFDKLVFLVQQLKDVIARKIGYSDSYSGTLDITIPSPTAGKYLVWNTALDGFDNASGTSAPTSFSQTLAEGNTSGANDVIVSSGKKLTTDTIDETVAAAGVTVDGVELKDGAIHGTDASKLKTYAQIQATSLLF